MALRLSCPSSVAPASTSKHCTAARRACPLPCGRRTKFASIASALPEGGEELTDAMRADLERYRQRQQQTQPASPPEASPSSSGGLKDTLDKVLIADFFLVLFVLAWLGAGVVQAGVSGGSSPLLDAWYPLWPILWQPAIGILMAGALVSGGVNWLQSQGQNKN